MSVEREESCPKFIVILGIARAWGALDTCALPTRLQTRNRWWAGVWLRVLVFPFRKSLRMETGGEGGNGHSHRMCIDYRRRCNVSPHPAMSFVHPCKRIETNPHFQTQTKTRCCTVSRVHYSRLIFVFSSSPSPSSARKQQSQVFYTPSR